MSDFDRFEEVEVDLPDYWAASRMKCIGQCGKRYYYKYIEKFPEPDTATLAFGSAIHKCLERIHIEKITEESQWQRLWFDVWFEYQQRVDWDQEFSRKSTFDNRGIKILDLYVNGSKDYPGHLDEEIIATEIKFTIEPKDELPGFRGVIDKVFVHEGRMAIMDYKTEKHPPDELVLRADPQFSIYYEAAKQLFGEAPIVGHHHLLSGLVTWTERTDKDINLVYKSVAEGIQKIKGNMFDRNIGYLCRFCPYKETCLTPIMKGEDIE